jgi:hypothetical protein
MARSALTETEKIDIFINQANGERICSPKNPSSRATSAASIIASSREGTLLAAKRSTFSKI